MHYILKCFFLKCSLNRYQLHRSGTQNIDQSENSKNLLKTLIIYDIPMINRKHVNHFWTFYVITILLFTDENQFYLSKLGHIYQSLWYNTMCWSHINVHCIVFYFEICLQSKMHLLSAEFQLWKLITHDATWLARLAVRGFSKWNPVSLLAWQKDLTVEVILISEFTDSEIKIISTFLSFCQANSLTGFHFENRLLLYNGCQVWEIFYFMPKLTAAFGDHAIFSFY